MSLAFGIPTIKREKTSYLLNTVASMLDGMTQEDKDDSVIVIFIGEVQCYNISHYHQYMYQFSSVVSKLNEDHSGFRK